MEPMHYIIVKGGAVRRSTHTTSAVAARQALLPKPAEGETLYLRVSGDNGPSAERSMVVDEVTLKDMEEGARDLCFSSRGRIALSALEKFLDDVSGLDHHNQQAVLAIIRGKFGAFAGSAHDVVRDAIHP